MVGATFERDIEPGEVVVIKGTDLKSYRPFPPAQLHACNVGTGRAGARATRRQGMHPQRAHAAVAAFCRAFAFADPVPMLPWR